MKVAFVAPAYPYRGGIAQFGMRLDRELYKNHDTRYLNFTRLYPDFLFPGKTQYDLSSRNVDFNSQRILDSINPITWRKSARYLRAFNPDVVIFHWWHVFFGPAYRAICSRLGQNVKKIAICHNVLPHDKGSTWKNAVKWSLTRFDGLVVHAEDELRAVHDLFPDKPVIKFFHPLYDVFHGHDIPKMQAREALNLPQDRKIGLYFGLIRPYKGVPVLLDAIKRLNDVEDFLQLIVGEIYSERDKIEKQVSEIGHDRVLLLDEYVPDEQVALWFRAADVIILPYITATQSGVIPIAYQCMRPVIATSVGGLPDVIEEGRSGMLVPPGESEALSQAIRQFIKTLPDRDYSDGIAQFRRKLSWENYTSQLVQFINELATH